MKHCKLNRLLIASLLLVLLLAMAACNQGTPEDTSALPDTIETVVTDDATEPDSEHESEVETQPTVSSVNFPSAELPDFAKYATANRIKEVLGSRTTLAVTANGVKYYANGELKAGGDGIVTKKKDGTVTLNATKLGALVGRSDLK